jgi:hypothetical protein
MNKVIKNFFMAYYNNSVYNVNLATEAFTKTGDLGNILRSGNWDMYNSGDRKTWFPRVPWLVQGGVILSFALSVVALILYMIGNMTERGFSDELQFFILRILQYLSLFLILFSFCALGFSVRLMIHEPRFRHLLGIGLYVLTGILGIVLVLLNSFIVVTAGGNG